MAGTVISTLTDSVNVSPVNWRQGSLTQRVAELALGGGGSSSTGSQTASTGIVRGFDVYPVAEELTVQLLPSQGTLDSLVVFTDAGSGATLQYRTFTTVTVTLPSGDFLVAFRPDFERRVIELVSYSENEYEDGKVEDDEAVIIAWVKSSGMIPRTGILYAGQTDDGVFYQRGQVYSPDIVERVVFDFRDGDPVPFEISGSKTLSITNGALQVSGSGTGIIRIPVYQYMLPDNREVGFPDTASKIRAIVRYTGNENNIESSSLYFTLSDGTTTAVTSLDYPAGNANFGTTEFTRAVEIIPEQGVGRPNWAYLTLRFANTTTLAEITEIVLEVDRVNPALATGTAMVLGQALYQGATDADFVRVDSGGVLVTTGTASTTVSATGVVAETSTTDTTVSATGVSLNNGTEVFTLDISSGLTLDSGTEVVEMLPTSVTFSTSGNTGEMTSEKVKITKSGVSSTTLDSGKCVATGSTFTAAFGDLRSAPFSLTNFGVYAENSATGDKAYLVEDGIAVTDDTLITTVTKLGLAAAGGGALSQVLPDGVSTNGANGFTGKNAPVLIIGVDYKAGSNWNFFGNTFNPFGAVSLVGTNNATQFTINLVGTSVTHAFVVSSISGAVLSVLYPAANRIRVDLSVSAIDGNFCQIMAFNI